MSFVVGRAMPWDLLVEESTKALSCDENGSTQV